MENMQMIQRDNSYQLTTNNENCERKLVTTKQEIEQDKQVKQEISPQKNNMSGMWKDTLATHCLLRDFCEINPWRII